MALMVALAATRLDFSLFQNPQFALGVKEKDSAYSPKASYRGGLSRGKENPSICVLRNLLLISK